MGGFSISFFIRVFLTAAVQIAWLQAPSLSISGALVQAQAPAMRGSASRANNPANLSEPTKFTKLIAQLAAECDHGQAHSCTKLGLLYAEGRGLAKDDKASLDLFQRACDAGLAGACSDLGAIYSSGRGIYEKQRRAAEFFQRACDEDSPSGCFNLGGAYFLEGDIPNDDARAAESFRRAC